MKDDKIIKEVMSQHFKIADDYTWDNIIDALDNYSDKLASKIALKQVVSESLLFDYFDRGMFTAFVLAQNMTEGMEQAERDKYFEMMIDNVEQRRKKNNVR